MSKFTYKICSEDSFFNFNLKWTRKMDHAGFYFLFTVWDWMFCFNFHDNRHWDDDTNNWNV